MCSATDTAPREGTISGPTEKTARQLMGTVGYCNAQLFPSTGMWCVVTYSCHSDHSMQCCPLVGHLFSQLLVTATLVAPSVSVNRVEYDSHDGKQHTCVHVHIHSTCTYSSELCRLHIQCTCIHVHGLKRQNHYSANPVHIKPLIKLPYLLAHIFLIPNHHSLGSAGRQAQTASA